MHRAVCWGWLLMGWWLAMPGYAGETKPDYYPIRLRGHRYERQAECDLKYEVPGDYALTGVGLRAADGRIATAWFVIRPLLPDGTLGPREVVYRGSDPLRGHPEGSVELPDGQVMVGFGIRIDPWWDIGVLSVWGARLHRDGTLGDPVEVRAGMNPNAETEQQILLRGDRLLTGLGIAVQENAAIGLMAQSATASRYPLPEPPPAGSQWQLTDWRLEPSGRTQAHWFAPPGRVITGLSMRARDATVATLNIRTHALTSEGELTDPQLAMCGWFSDPEPEGEEALLPEGHVATGVGLTIAMVADVRDLVVHGAPLNPDGTLGPATPAFGGFGPRVETQQVETRLEESRVLTGVGFWIDNDAALSMLTESARIIPPTAE